MAEKQSVKAVRCFYCHQEGHFGRDCPKKKESRASLCYYCNQAGHIKRNCPELQSLDCTTVSKKPAEGSTNVATSFSAADGDWPRLSKQSEKKESRAPNNSIICYYCNQTGHIKRNCPELRSLDCTTVSKKPAEGSTNVATSFSAADGDWPSLSKQSEKKESRAPNNSIICYYCNQAGHIKRNCPELHVAQSSDCTTVSRKPTERSKNAATSFTAADGDWPSLSKQSEMKVGLDQNSMSRTKDYVYGEASPALNSDATRITKVQIPYKSSCDKKNSGVTPPIRSGNKEETEKKYHQEAERDSKGACGDSRGHLGGEKDIISRKEKVGIHDRRTPFVDTHCHLEYVFERYNHTKGFLDFTRQWKYPRNFDGCIASFCDPAAFSSFGTWSDLLSEPESKVWAAFGIHPHNAKYYFTTSGLEEKLLNSLEHERCVAFGEIGLDYGERSPSDAQTQKEVFTRQLQLGVTMGKPFVLHCRDAEQDMLEILMKHVPKDWKIHFHCFTGKISFALEYLATFPRSYLGVCGNVTYDNARNVAAVAREVPLDRLLVETDAPYNAPRNLPREGWCRHSHPAHAYYVAKEIARLRNLDLVEVLRTIRANTKSMYGI